MAKVVLQDIHLQKLAEADRQIREVNVTRITILFEALGLKLKAGDLEKMLGWDLILIAVSDREMAVQLNRLAAYIPNLKFVADEALPLFAITQGKSPRRAWKKR